jgi:hypothetical protein
MARVFAGAILAVGLTVARVSATSEPDATWWWAYQTGVMTDDRAAEALNPSRTRFTENYLLGFVLGYDRQIGQSRFSIGAEFQANAHFGDQGFYEIVAPVSVRYHPDQSWGNAFDSFAFGFGYSHYSELSNLELENYDGMSRRNLFYWYLEAEFAELASGDNLFIRLHHRSNAYDTVEPNGGSNVWTIGFRREF